MKFFFYIEALHTIKMANHLLVGHNILVRDSRWGTWDWTKAPVFQQPTECHPLMERDCFSYVLYSQVHPGGGTMANVKPQPQNVLETQKQRAYMERAKLLSAGRMGMFAVWEHCQCGFDGDRIAPVFHVSLWCLPSGLCCHRLHYVTTSALLSWHYCHSSLFVWHILPVGLGHKCCWENNTA